MAIAVIGGIIVSTVLSLIVVPSFFLIMDDLSNLLGRLFGRLVGAKEPEPEAPDVEAMAATQQADHAEIEALRERLARLEKRPDGRGGLHVA